MSFGDETLDTSMGETAIFLYLISNPSIRMYESPNIVYTKPSTILMVGSGIADVEGCHLQEFDQLSMKITCSEWNVYLYHNAILTLQGI